MLSPCKTVKALQMEHRWHSFAGRAWVPVHTVLKNSAITLDFFFGWVPLGSLCEIPRMTGSVLSCLGGRISSVNEDDAVLMLEDQHSHCSLQSIALTLAGDQD